MALRFQIEYYNRKKSLIELYLNGTSFGTEIEAKREIERIKEQDKASGQKGKRIRFKIIPKFIKDNINC